MTRSVAAADISATAPTHAGARRGRCRATSPRQIESYPDPRAQSFSQIGRVQERIVATACARIVGVLDGLLSCHAAPNSDGGASEGRTTSSLPLRHEEHSALRVRHLLDRAYTAVRATRESVLPIVVARSRFPLTVFSRRASRASSIGLV